MNIIILTNTYDAIWNWHLTFFLKHYKRLKRYRVYNRVIFLRDQADIYQDYTMISPLSPKTYRFLRTQRSNLYNIVKAFTMYLSNNNKLISSIKAERWKWYIGSGDYYSLYCGY